MGNNRLYRSETDRILGGVCGGFAEVYDMDPTLVRLLTVLIVLATGIGPLLYLVAWLIMPSEGEVKQVSREVTEVELDEKEGDSEESEEEDDQEDDEESEKEE